jgi:cytoplasmic iron level regulating protein YaaA (DUF328/UPF0246 family)
MSKTIALVTCVSKKNQSPMPASELYCSELFQKMSAYARKNSDEWYILSAKYGLLSPDKVISPYNQTLNNMSSQERLEWSRKVVSDLEQVLSPGDQVIFLAGMKYREHLVDPIRRMGCNVSIPMEGLRFGEQLNWLKSNLE